MDKQTLELFINILYECNSYEGYSICRVPGSVNLPILKKSGIHSTWNSLLQMILNCCFSASLSIDGYFGDKTEAAVKALQQEHKIDIDGIVGTQTWTILLK